jgi:spore coat protein U-like protein
MYKLITFVLFLLIFHSENFCQNKFVLNTPISISLTNGVVINRISGDLDFGEALTLGSMQTLTKSPDIGVLFEVNGITDNRVTINYSTSVVLNNSAWISNNGGPSGDLIFTPDVKHTGENSNYVNPKNVRNGRKIKLKNGIEGNKLFLWVGGSVEIQVDQPRGEYQGTFNITVTYN